MCNSRLPQGFLTIWLRRHPLTPVACLQKCFLSDDLSGDDIVHPKEKKHRSGAHNYHTRILFYSRWWTVFASLPLGSEDCSTDTCNILLTMRTPLSCPSVLSSAETQTERNSPFIPRVGDG